MRNSQLGQRREVTAAALLLLGIFAILVAVQRSSVGYDGNIMYAVARNIVQHGSLKTTGQDPYGFDPFGFNTPYSAYGIGTSLLIAPATALELVLGTRPFGLVSLVNPMVVASTGVFAQRIGIARGWSLRLSTAAAALGVLATPLLWLGTELFSEPTVTLCCAIVLLAAIRWRDGRSWAPLAMGIAIGIAIQFRSDSILLVGISLLTLPLFVPWRTLLADRRGLVRLLAPVAVSVLALAWYDMVRFNTPLPIYESGGGVANRFNTPLTVGLRGLLVSPSKGLFVFAPFLLIGLVGFLPLYRRDRAVAALIALLSFARILFYARWSSWGGGVGWGPRFLAPLFVLLVVPTVEARRRDGRWTVVEPWRILAAVLVPVSLFLSVLSVAVPYEQWWNTYVGNAAKSEVAQRSHDYYFSVGNSHVVGDLKMIEDGRATAAPYWWRNGPRRVVVALLVLGLGAIVGALALDRPRSTRRREFERAHAPPPLE